MLEWLICAASVATRAPSDAGLASQESTSQADFFEFLADWDENDAAALDVDVDDGQVDAIAGGPQGGKVAKTGRPSSPGPAPERGEDTR